MLFVLTGLDADDEITPKFIKTYLKRYYPPKNRSSLKRCVVQLSSARIKNCFQGTAAERFNIKGLRLRDDSILWMTFIDYEYSMYKYPSSYMRAGNFIKMMKRVKWARDFPSKWRCVSKLAALSFHAGAAVYNLGAKYSLSYWCRYLSEYVTLLFYKLERKLADSKRLARRFPGIDFRKWSPGFTFDGEQRASLFFQESFFRSVHDLLLMCFADVCGCGDCRETLLRDVRPETRRQRSSVTTTVELCPELDLVDLPVLPHLGEALISILHREISRDFALGLIEGRLMHSSLPLFLELGHVNRDYKIVLILLTNIVFLLFVLKGLYSVVHKEVDMYYQFFQDECQTLAQCLEDELNVSSDDDLPHTKAELDLRCLQYHLREVLCTPQKKTDFIFSCIGIVKAGFDCEGYKTYRNKTKMSRFLKHHLRVTPAYSHTDPILVAADNIIPSFFLVESKNLNFIKVLDESRLSVDDDRLSNVRDIDGAVSLFFSELKMLYLEGETVEISREKDTRTVAYRLHAETEILPREMPGCKFYVVNKKKIYSSMSL